MKKINSILMRSIKMPSASYGVKLLIIPCLIAVLSLSAFRSKGIQETSGPALTLAEKATTFSDPYARMTPGWVFIDLDGVEYQDVWVEFFDEDMNPVIVYDITINYEILLTDPNGVLNMDRVLSGSSTYLLEDNAYYFVPHSSRSGGRSYFYSLLPGTGYISI
jgi:hypothetical protein